jgi:hypothetical protein
MRRRKPRNDQQQRLSVGGKKDKKKDAAENSYRNSFIRPSLAVKNGIVVRGRWKLRRPGGPAVGASKCGTVWWWWCWVFWGCKASDPIVSLAKGVAPATNCQSATHPAFRAHPLSQVTLWTMERRQSSAVCPTTLNLKHINPILGSIGSHLPFAICHLPCAEDKISGWMLSSALIFVDDVLEVP